MNSQWSDNLRKRMEAHEEPSPDGLWEDIEQIVTKELPFRTREHPVQSPSGQKKILLWAKKIGAVAAILLILLFVGDFFLKEDTRHSPAISQRPEVGHKPGNNLSIDHNNERIFSRKKFATNPLPLIIISQPSQHRLLQHLQTEKRMISLLTRKSTSLAVETKVNIPEKDPVWRKKSPIDTPYQETSITIIIRLNPTPIIRLLHGGTNPQDGRQVSTRQIPHQALQIHTMVTEVFWLKRFLREKKMWHLF